MIKLYLLKQGGGWRVSFVKDTPTDIFVKDRDFKTKFFAQLYAIQLAKDTVKTYGTPISLLIQDNHGHWQEERTYPRSADPTGSPG